MPEGPPRLTDLRFIKEILTRHRFRLSSRLGQNFLRNEAILQCIVETAAPDGERVIEVGPGLGTLTRALAERADRVIAIEAARRLEPVLGETLTGLRNVSLIFEDFLRVPSERLAGAPAVLAANLPYNITTPVLFRFLDGEIAWKRIVVMVQAELAERIVAAPGTHEYGALSVAAQSAGATRLVRRVPSASFWPAPRVESAILLIEPRLDAVSPKRLRPLLRSAFSSRRKTLKNALRAFPRSLEALQQLEIDPGLRPENVTVAEWARLATALDVS